MLLRSVREDVLLEGESEESILRNNDSLLGGGDGEDSDSDEEVWSILAS